MIDGIPVRYDIKGQGAKNFLLIHGFIESIELFESFSDKLSKSGKVLTIDLPGCGMSGYDGRECLSMEYFASVVYSVIQKVQFGRSIAIGHSMGGYILLALSQLHEECFEKLVLLHSTPFAATETRKIEREKDLEIMLSGKKSSLIDVNSKGRFAAENYKKFRDEILDMAEAVEMCDDQAIAATIRGLISRVSHEDYFKECKLPRMMIFGKQDSYIQLSRAEEVASAFPDAKVLWLEHSGHMGFIEEPDIIIENL